MLMMHCNLDFGFRSMCLAWRAALQPSGSRIVRQLSEPKVQKARHLQIKYNKHSRAYAPHTVQNICWIQEFVVQQVEYH